LSAARRVDRESRRDALIDAAVEVFARKTVAKTAVSDIVREAGVAQGTFYLYFASKGEAIDAAAESIADRMLESIEEAVFGAIGGAVSKLLALRDAFLAIGADPDLRELAELYHRPENRATHDRMADRLLLRLAPLVERIVTEGVDEGVFAVEHPRTAAWLVLGSLHVLEHADLNWGDLAAAVVETMDYVLRALGFTGMVQPTVRKIPEEAAS
jgi:TetR/AcrR family fatty acid metabolism transcriptional regulator